MDGVSNSKMKQPLRIKIISMGSAEVGKSCVIKRYCEKKFISAYHATIGIDYGVSKITSKGRDVKVNIFDMAGHPIFHEIRNEFYGDTQGVLLVYDVSNRLSFDALDDWITEMRSYIGNVAEMENIIFVVCANKKDKKRVVDDAEGRTWADTHGFLFYEVSALNGEGISEMFQALYDGVVTAIENGGRLPKSTQLGYTRDQVDAIQKLKKAKDDYQRLGLPAGASADEINKSFRRLSVLLHPDKSVAPGSEEAFKLLVAARTNLLKQASK